MKCDYVVQLCAMLRRFFLVLERVFSCGDFPKVFFSGRIFFSRGCSLVCFFCFGQERVFLAEYFFFRQFFFGGGELLRERVKKKKS